MGNYNATYNLTDMVPMSVDLGAKITKGVVGEGNNIGKTISGLIVISLAFLILAKIFNIPEKFKNLAENL